MESNLKAKLSASLKETLPGEAAHLLMASTARDRIKHSGLKQFAAVIILLYPQNNETYTTFIKRPEYEGVHGGQIAFPGGKLEIHDLNLEHTAIRECREELGIREDMEILGSLSPLFIPVSGFEVHPYVAFTSKKPTWHPDPDEVEKVIELSINHLLNPTNKITEKWNLNGFIADVPIYRINDQYKIWGATAMITSEFLEVYKKAVLD